MSWAAQRRFVILVIIGAVVVAFLATFSIATFYKAPSCADGVRNQDETGVDCGGSCAYLCAEQAQPPTVLFTKLLSNGSGRIDVIAQVENKNVAAAAKNIPYRITLYGADQARIQEVTGTLDLLPGARLPVFVPGIYSGQQAAGSAFLTIESSAPRWFAFSADALTVPKVTRTVLGGTPSAPRVEASLVNASTAALTNVRAVVLVRGASGEVIAASATVVPVIPAQGNALALFTWNSAFASMPASIEIIPIIPLPVR